MVSTFAIQENEGDEGQGRALVIVSKKNKPSESLNAAETRFGEAALQGPPAQPRDPSSSLSISPATAVPDLSASQRDGTVFIPRQRVWDQKQLWDAFSAAWAVCG